MRLNKLSSMIFAVAIVASAVAVQADQVTIDLVPVGDAGNAADSTGYGSVSYNYNIGTYEVTAGQYTAFLNAVAASSDDNALYNVKMWEDPLYGCKIERSVLSNHYVYSVASEYANRPVNYVSFGDAMRFTNWLQNGQPTGTQTNSTTEDGAYFVNGATSDADLLAVNRKTDWKWAVTSENEWYKAAYYDPNKSGMGVVGYWDYPTKSNTAPGRDMADPLGNNANCPLTDSPAFPFLTPIDSPYYATEVGQFQKSAGPYGTFDQGGNVWEWNESRWVNYQGKDVRGVRGGAFDDPQYGLHANTRIGFASPSLEHFDMGFRVASVPEPSTLALLSVGIIGLLGFAWRRRKPA
ncbi:MAG: SUMF1/EgtB/PvdO family nonheme iron enzyme [Planctomycetota bacterium]